MGTKQTAVAGPVERGVRPAVAEALRLAHAYADAKLMSYGALGIPSPPDPQAAFEALEVAVNAVVAAERDRWADKVMLKNLALMAAASILERIEIADGGTYGDLRETMGGIAEALRA